MFQVEEFQLKNGLKVLLVPAKKSPVVSVQVWVDTGSADEPESLAGISHFIEHLVFKGTQSYEVGQIASTIEGSGGQLNAYTSFDETVFHVTLSSKHIDTGLRVISEMMSSPRFDEDEVNSEREVVIEEIKKGLDSPSRQIFQNLFSAMYPKHNYGRPVIGYESVVKEVSRNEIKKYFLEKYKANKMFLIVSGSFDRDEIKPKIQNYFYKNFLKPTEKNSLIKNNQIESRKRSSSASSTNSVKTDKAIEVLRKPFKEYLVKISWPMPPIHHKDIPALEVFSMILGQGESSRLVQALRLSKALTQYAGCGLFLAKDPGLFTISLSTQAQNLKECLSELNKTLSDFFENGIDSEELQRAINNYESQEYYLEESVDGRASAVGYYTHLFKDPLYHEKFLKQIYRVSEADIMSILRGSDYLNSEKLKVICFCPEEDDSSQVEGFLDDWLGEYKNLYKSFKSLKKEFSKVSPVPNRQVRKIKSTKSNLFLEKELEDGSRLILNTNNDSPVINFKAGFLGGLLREPLGGLSELSSRIYFSESKNLSESEIIQKSDFLSSSISSFSGRNSIGLSLSSLSWNFEKMWSMTQAILEPHNVSERILQREKELMLEEIKLKSDHPAAEAIQEFLKAMFRDHPYAKDALGTKESVDKLTVQDVQNFMSEMKDPKNTVFVVSGALADPDKFISDLTDLTKSFSKSRNFLEPTNLEIKANKVFLERKKEQSHLVLGYEGLDLRAKETYALDLMQAILSGMGGRLFFELREKNSLAYTVSPLRMDGRGVGYFGAYIGCSSDKVKKSYESLKEEFLKLCENLVKPEELERAKRFLIGKKDIDLQKNSSIASEILFNSLYGINFKEIYDCREKLQAVTREDILELSRKLFSRPEVLSLVGSENPLF